MSRDKMSIKTLLKNKQTILESKLSILLDHPVTKGDHCESAWIDFFRSFLPNKYAVDKGFVFDAAGNISDQIDIIIYDALYSPLIFGTDAGEKFVTVESVYAVFDSKPSINKDTLEYRQRPVWHLPRGTAALINTEVHFPDGHKEIIENDGVPIPKGCGLYYRALHGIKSPYSVRWQVVNTGDEAKANTCLRGGFEISNVGTNMRYENTAYTGKHYIQCFIIKSGSCVAKSKEFIINVN